MINLIPIEERASAQMCKLLNEWAEKRWAGLYSSLCPWNFFRFRFSDPELGDLRGDFRIHILIPSEFPEQVKFDEKVKVPEEFEITPFILANYQFFNVKLRKLRLGEASIWWNIESTWCTSSWCIDLVHKCISSWCK